MESAAKRVRAKNIGIDFNKLNFDALETLCSKLESIIKSRLENRLKRRISSMNVVVTAEITDVLTFSVEVSLVARAIRSSDLEVLLDDAIEGGFEELEKILRSKFRISE